MDFSERNLKKKKKKKVKLGSFIFVMLLLVLCLTLFAGYVFLDKSRNFPENISGSYVRNLDITDEVLLNASLYLSDASGVTVNADIIREKIGRVEIPLAFSITPLGKNILGFEEQNGSYAFSLDSSIYEEKSEAVYNSVESIMKDMILERLGKLDYSPEDNATDIDSIVTKALGTSISEYLKNNSISFMPSYEELDEAYASSGLYSIKKGIITLSNEEEKNYEFVLSGDELLLSESSGSGTGFVYRKER